MLNLLFRKKSESYRAFQKHYTNGFSDCIECAEVGMAQGLSTAEILDQLRAALEKMKND